MKSFPALLWPIRGPETSIQLASQEFESFGLGYLHFLTGEGWDGFGVCGGPDGVQAGYNRCLAFSFS